MKVNTLLENFSFANNYDNYPDGVIIIDSSNNIVRWNKKCREIFGYTENEMLGRNIAVIFDYETEKINECLEKQNKHVISSKNKQDKDIFLEISCEKLDKKKKTIITVRDATKKQKVIEKLLIEYEKAARTSTMKNNFITALSNDFKAPVHSLIGFSESLLDGIGGDLSEKQTKYLNIMNKNANNLLNFISDFLELSQFEIEEYTPEMKVFDVISSIKEVSDRIIPLASNKGIRFEAEFEEIKKKNIYYDENILVKTLSILLDNALKFTKTGFIGLKVNHPDMEFVKSKEIEVKDDFSEQSWLLFHVVDTGAGIAEEDINIIFDEYNPLARGIAKKYGGTGLKLPLVKKMITKTGGKIWVESKPKHGSVFSFLIPVKRPEISIESSPNIETETDQSKKEPEKIAVAE